MRRRARLVAASLLALLIVAGRADAATYWIDARNSPSLNCGTSSANACPSIGYLLGQGGCPGTCGCDSNGCSPGPGDTVKQVAVAGGSTYVGRGTPLNAGITLTTSGNAGAPLTFECVDTTGTYFRRGCTWSGTGINFANQRLVDIGGSFIVLRGFVLTNVLQGSGTWGAMALLSGASHIRLEGMLFDMTPSTNNMSYALGGVGNTQITIVDTEFRNCTDGATGCVFGSFAADAAAVNVRASLSGIPGVGNSDAFTLQDTIGFLITNGTFNGANGFEGIDVGSLSGARSPSNGIIRWNRVYGAGNRQVKLSGDGDHAVEVKDISLYGNVLHHAGVAQGNGFAYMELPRAINSFNNTIFTLDNGQGRAFWYYIRTGGGWPQVTGTLLDAEYNIIASNAGPSSGPIYLEHDAGATACPDSAPCPLVGNIFSEPNSPTGTCVFWDQSDVAAASYACNQTGTFGTCESGTLNTGQAEHTCNAAIDPGFVNRNSAVTFANLALTAGSPVLNTAEPFCRASAGGGGNTITVTCRGKETVARGAKKWFVAPGQFYLLANDDCKQGEWYAVNGTKPGCYDFQIEGPCGVRQITSLAADGSSITFDGSACTWSNGAAVHIPWVGAASEPGAFEFNPNPGATATATSTPLATVTPTATGATPTKTATPTPTKTPTPVPTSTSDPCSAPIVVPAEGGVFTGTTAGGSNAIASGCASTGLAPERVYRWTPAISGTATIDTCAAIATAIDTVLAVRVPSCSAGPETQCNNDASACESRADSGGTTRGSRITMAVTAGTTYFLVVEGVGGASGAYQLTIALPKTTPGRHQGGRHRGGKR